MTRGIVVEGNLKFTCLFKGFKVEYLRKRLNGIIALRMLRTKKKKRTQESAKKSYSN